MIDDLLFADAVFECEKLEVIKMLNLKELNRLRRLIDFSVDSDEPEVVKIRDKLTDMIILLKAWNRGKRIEEECIHDLFIDEVKQ